MQKTSSFGPKMGEKWLFYVESTFTHWFYLKNGGKTYPVTVSLPEWVEFWLRCLNRGNLTLQIRIRRFRVISTPSGGQKWRKTWFFRVLLNRKSPRHLGDGLWKQKMFVYDIETFFVFTAKNFFKKIIHDGHRTRKHGKFKSKKQIFTDFWFLLQKTLLDPQKHLCKRKNDLNKNWASYGRLKVFGCRWLNFAALWWPKYAFVAIFDSGFSISAKNRSIWYTNLKKYKFFWNHGHLVQV